MVGEVCSRVEVDHPTATSLAVLAAILLKTQEVESCGKRLAHLELRYIPILSFALVPGL